MMDKDFFMQCLDALESGDHELCAKLLRDWLEAAASSTDAPSTKKPKAKAPAKKLAEPVAQLSASELKEIRRAGTSPAAYLAVKKKRARKGAAK